MKVATRNIIGWTNDKSVIVQLFLADYSVVGFTKIWIIALKGKVNGNGPKEKRIKFSSSVNYPKKQLKSL